MQIAEESVPTILGNYNHSVNIRRWTDDINYGHPIIKTVGKPFDKLNFDTPTYPLIIGEAFNEKKFSDVKNLQVFDCPIKFPTQKAEPFDYRVPVELNQFDEVISKIVSYEHTINKDVHNYYAYITADQKYIKANEYHRTPGCHSNGFQGSTRPKIPVSRSYIVYDRVSPLFFPQKFETRHLNECEHDFFPSFDEQVDYESWGVEEGRSVCFDRYSIILTNPYTIRAEASVEYPIYRTFFKLTFDMHIFDRPGNTYNPAFTYMWPAIARNKDHLRWKTSSQSDFNVSQINYLS